MSAGDERFYIEWDGIGDVTIWRVGMGPDGQDVPVLRERDVRDADLWRLICDAVTG